MKKTNKKWSKTKIGMGLALAGALSTPAFAAPGDGTGGGGGGQGVYEIKLDLGVSKRQGLITLSSGAVRASQNRGAGNEHAALAVDGTTMVVVHASNNVKALNGPSGIKCVSLDLHADGPPTIRARNQFTYSNSDRLGHPAIATDGAGHFLVAYGANNIQGNGNTQTYALATDKDCNDLTGGNWDANNNPHPEERHARLNGNANNNEAAPRVFWQKDKFVVGYYANSDASYALLAQIVPGQNGTTRPKRITQVTRVTPSNIGRPSILLMGDNRALFAAPRGNQRPSENGDEIALLNTDLAAAQSAGATKVLWKKIVVAAKPDANNIGGVDGLPGPLGGNGIYPASPTVIVGEKPGEVYLTTFISNGAGRNRNKKGSSTSYMTKLMVTDSGVTKMAEESNIGLESSHIVACDGMSGIVGSESHQVAIYGAPITGFGNASLSLFSYDETQKVFPLKTAYAIGSTRVDGGYLNNYLGRNPQTQGREHLQCYGDVQNLAYHSATATFMPKVKSFWVLPHTGRESLAGTNAPLVQAADGRMLPEDRNALYLTFVPAVRDADAPVPPPPAAPTPSPDPGSNANNGGGTTDPGPVAGNGGGTPGTDTPGTPGGFTGGCSYGGEASSSGALALVMIGAALLLIARRRSES